MALEPAFCTLILAWLVEVPPAGALEMPRGLRVAAARLPYGSLQLQDSGRPAS